MSITIARPQRTIRPGRARRVLAGLVSTAVVAAGISLVSAPTAATAADEAPAATTAPSLTWKISDWFNEHLSTRTFSGGAESDGNGVITFPNGVGTFNSATGAASIAYSGSVRGAFAFSGTTIYAITISNPTVTVAADGEGTISAEVSSVVPPSAESATARVVLTTFEASAGDWTTTNGVRSLTDTPDWEGVLPAGSAAAIDAGITNTARPVDGKSFAAPFIKTLNPGLRAHFYVSGSNPTTDAKKNASTFTAEAPVAAATATATSSAPASVSVAVSGTGYSASQPGIYVGVGESGLTDLTDASKFVGTIWSNSPANPTFAVKADGTFAATLSLSADDVAKLDKNKTYSVYTFKAHGQNATDGSQTVEVPVAIDFSGFPKKVATATVSAPASTFGNESVVTVDVPAVGGFAPTGTVTLTGAGTQTATIAGGKATFTLPKTLSAGATALTATYAGDANFGSATAAATITVTAAKVSVKRGTTKKPTTKKTGTSSLTLKSATGAAVDGKVTVTFTKKGQKTKVKTVTIKAGKGKITIPKLAKGTWTVSVKYAGTTNFLKTATLKRGSFTVVK